jgi:hypothetical protein
MSRVVTVIFGRAIAKAFSLWLPTAAARVPIRTGMCSLWRTKRHWGKFSPSTSVSPANHHSTRFSIIILNRGWHNRPNFESVANYLNFKTLYSRRHDDYLFFVNTCIFKKKINCYSIMGIAGLRVVTKQIESFPAQL